MKFATFAGYPQNPAAVDIRNIYQISMNENAAFATFAGYPRNPAAADIRNILHINMGETRSFSGVLIEFYARVEENIYDHVMDIEIKYLNSPHMVYR